MREHIDLLIGIGSNARASYRRYLRHHIGPLFGASPVTAVGYREVAGFISVDVLLPLLASKAPDELLFPNAVGQRPSSSRFWTSTWTPALDAACNPRRPDGSPDPDAPRLTKRPHVHDLRHTHASWMPAAGTDLFVLQRRLDHESITTTTETYAHLMPDQQRAAADAAAKALRGLVAHASRP